MKITIKKSVKDMGQASGKLAAELIRKAVQNRGYANIILATGTSQFETLNYLAHEKNMPWDAVNMFHLDEYLGLPLTHNASFRKYLKERFIDKLEPKLKFVHLINAEKEGTVECTRLGDVIRKHPIDVALVGIGENGHLAFNDPPADFETEEPYLVVELDDACRHQQFSEGWFESLEAVPKQAISMSIHQIMLSSKIICSVPDERKAEAVKNCLEGEISNIHPASILRQHPDCELFLDESAAKLLNLKNPEYEVL